MLYRAEVLGFPTATMLDGADWPLALVFAAAGPRAERAALRRLSSRRVGKSLFELLRHTRVIWWAVATARESNAQKEFLMRNLMIGAACALAISGLTIAHADETGCGQKTVGSTSYGDEASKTATTSEKANIQIRPGEKVSGPTSYGDEAAKTGNSGAAKVAKDDKTAANAQIGSNGAQDCNHAQWRWQPGSRGARHPQLPCMHSKGDFGHRYGREQRIPWPPTRFHPLFDGPGRLRCAVAFRGQRLPMLLAAIRALKIAANDDFEHPYVQKFRELSAH
jgi:hypothetical protein